MLVDAQAMSPRVSRTCAGWGWLAAISTWMRSLLQLAQSAPGTDGIIAAAAARLADRRGHGATGGP